METKIKDWYIKEYPDDIEMGEEMNDNVTFQDLFEALDNYQDVYEVLGGESDSIVRERCFSKLAELMDVDYNYIYEQWLKSSDY